jgi:hypothetical protein
MPSVPKYFRTFSSCPRARGSFNEKNHPIKRMWQAGGIFWQ